MAFRPYRVIFPGKALSKSRLLRPQTEFKFARRPIEKNISCRPGWGDILFSGTAPLA